MTRGKTVVARHAVRLTAHFERNLQSIEAFLMDADAPGAFDSLLDELTSTTIPNLQRFPGMGRPFVARPLRSVETTNGVERLMERLKAVDPGGELREYVMADYLLLYARLGSTVHLLSIRHHRQLSFDFARLWPDHDGPPGR